MRKAIFSKPSAAVLPRVKTACTALGFVNERPPPPDQNAGERSCVTLWSCYIGVDDVDRAAAAVIAGGGMLNGATMEFPGGEFSVHCSDPQGAAFGLVGPRKV